ncbi:MAG: type I-C CRISPR-associated protein Cas8c/Csd1 [Dehalococcoidia bacterium]
MLIQRLRQYAEQELAAELESTAFEEAPVRWLITIDGKGSFLGLTDRTGEDKRVGPSTIPKIGVRTVGVVPNLAVDNVNYVLGPTEGMEGNELRKVRKQHAAFQELLRQATVATEDAGLDACVAFYADTRNVEAVRAELRERDSKPVDRYAFMLAEDNGLLVCRRPAAVDFWNTHSDARTAARGAKPAVASRKADSPKDGPERPGVGRCLCCGQEQPLADRHMTKIRPVPDGQQAGTSLVSFNEEAFESYGWKAAYNSPTCNDCVEAYARALNRLLRRDGSPRTRIDESGVAILYWTIGGDSLDLNDWLEQPDPERVRDLLRAPRTGSVPGAIDSGAFCTLALSGSGGRVMIRQWLDLTIEEARANLADWFDDLELIVARRQSRGNVVLREAGQPALPPGLWTLLDALARDRKEIPKNLPPELVRVALTGGPLPTWVLAAAVRRMAVERGAADAWTAPARLGLIRAALNRAPGSKGAQRMNQGLDREQMSSGYLCGRLLAVLEGVQYAAVGDVGADIVDRFYGRAATAPRAAFPILLRLAQSHLRTLGRDKPGLRVNLERELQEIAGKLPGRTGFPAFLPLEEQGRFALGFYHQKAERFHKRPDSGATPEDAAPPAD